MICTKLKISSVCRLSQRQHCCYETLLTKDKNKLLKSRKRPRLELLLSLSTRKSLHYSEFVLLSLSLSLSLNYIFNLRQHSQLICSSRKDASLRAQWSGFRFPRGIWSEIEHSFSVSKDYLKFVVVMVNLGNVT